MNFDRWRLLLVSLSMIVSACSAGEQRPEKPPVIEVFACSDHCPGPREKYLRKVYEGIDDEESCKAIGGTPYVFLGWGSTFICLAD